MRLAPRGGATRAPSGSSWFSRVRITESMTRRNRLPSTLPDEAMEASRSRAKRITRNLADQVASCDSPPRQHRDRGEPDGSGVAEQGSRTLSEGTPCRHRREACGRGGGDQADPPGGIAVENRP
jgi:hypothetical protein